MPRQQQSRRFYEEARNRQAPRLLLGICPTCLGSVEMGTGSGRLRLRTVPVPISTPAPPEKGDRHLEDSEPIPLFRLRSTFEKRGTGTSKTRSQSPFSGSAPFSGQTLGLYRRRSEGWPLRTLKGGAGCFGASNRDTIMTETARTITAPIVAFRGGFRSISGFRSRRVMFSQIHVSELATSRRGSLCSPCRS